jgi:hypothetical protein
MSTLPSTFRPPRRHNPPLHWEVVAGYLDIDAEEVPTVHRFANEPGELRRSDARRHRLHRSAQSGLGNQARSARYHVLPTRISALTQSSPASGRRMALPPAGSPAAGPSWRAPRRCGLCYSASPPGSRQDAGACRQHHGIEHFLSALLKAKSTLVDALELVASRRCSTAMKSVRPVRCLDRPWPQEGYSCRGLHGSGRWSAAPWSPSRRRP